MKSSYFILIVSALVIAGVAAGAYLVLRPKEAAPSAPQENPLTAKPPGPPKKDLLAALWAGKAHFEVLPGKVAPIVDHMHFISMFWDGNHYKAYYITGVEGNIWTGLAKSADGFNFESAGVVLKTGSPGSWDDRMASFSSVWKEKGTYYLVYEGAGTSFWWLGDIGLATSHDGVNFEKEGLFLKHDTAENSFEKTNIGTPSLFKDGDMWYLFYHGFDGKTCQISVATGGDLKNLKKVGYPIIPTVANTWRSGTTGKRSRPIKEGEYWYMAFEGSTDLPYDKANWCTGIARSKDLINWEVLPDPVIPPTQGEMGHDGSDMIKIGDDIYIYFRTPASSPLGGNNTQRAKLIRNP